MNELYLWKQQRSYTVNEAMNLIIGELPGTYKFVFGDEAKIPKEAMLIYRMMASDLDSNTLKVFFKNTYEDPAYNEGLMSYYFDTGEPWWQNGKIFKSDLLDWLRHRKIESKIFNDSGIYNQSKSTEYSNKTHSTKTNATIKSQGSETVKPKLTNVTSMNRGMWLPECWVTEEPPEQEFCIDPLAPIGTVTLMNAHGGTGKSLLALKMAIHVALGKNILGAPTNGGKVAYMSLEDSLTILRERLYRIINDMKAIEPNVTDNIFTRFSIYDRYGVQTFMTKNVDGDIQAADITESLIDDLVSNNIKCLFVDTLIRTNNLNENNNAHMGALLAVFEKIARSVGCAVILLHHLPKGSENKAYSARGASAITDNSRSAMLLEKVTLKASRALHDDIMTQAASEGRLIKVTHTKHNYSKQHPVQYFEITEAGTPKEIIPTTDETAIIKKRYLELYKWYSTKWDKEVVVEDNIKKHYQSFRPESTNIGYRKYLNALDWALENGYAEKVDASEEKNYHPKAKYFKLKPIK